MIKNFQDVLKTEDSWLSNSEDIHYIRCVLLRARPGMNDFLLKVAIPNSNKRVVCTQRVSKSQCNSEGYIKIAQKLISQFSANNELSLDWENVNKEHLAQMLMSELKFFSTNTNGELLRFVTEALKFKETETQPKTDPVLK
jgi:hypothetical protein